MKYILMLLIVTSCSNPEIEALSEVRCKAVFAEKLNILRRDKIVIVRKEDVCVLSKFTEYEDVVLVFYNNVYYVEIKRY